MSPIRKAIADMMTQANDAKMKFASAGKPQT
jgi:hypothetical protein